MEFLLNNRLLYFPRTDFCEYSSRCYEIVHAWEGLVGEWIQKKGRRDVEGVGRWISCCVYWGEGIKKYNFLLEYLWSLDKFFLAQKAGAAATQGDGRAATTASGGTRSCSWWSSSQARAGNTVSLQWGWHRTGSRFRNSWNYLEKWDKAQLLFLGQKPYFQQGWFLYSMPVFLGSSFRNLWWEKFPQILICLWVFPEYELGGDLFPVKR